ncbi:MAG: hypothetical protein HOB51_03945 [Thaumarchaeota archaeon]|nr:hypothetical protein [Nitrososphaerota archaeon]
MKQVLIIAIVLIIMIVMLVPSVSAKEFSPTIDYRIDEIPTFCTKPVSTHEVFSNPLVADEEWPEYVEYAVKYWESELKKSAEYPDVWTMNFKKISKSAEYPDSCTIIIEYDQYTPWNWGGVLGVFWEEELFEIPTTETDAGRIWIFDESFRCIDDCENFDSHKLIKEVIVHEIGHSLGLGHFTYDDKDKNKRVENGQSKFPSIMYPFASDFVPVATITSKDVSKINSIYGTYGFYAFSENIPDDLFDEDVIIIPGIPISEVQPFKSISISEEKINIPKSKYQPILLTLSGNMNGYNFSPAEKISIQIFHPDGGSESFLVSITSSGLFQLTFQIDNTYPLGVYTIEPSHRGVFSQEFKQTFEILPLGQEIIKEEIIHEEILKVIPKDYDYELHLPKIIELSKDSDSIVSGNLVPTKNMSNNFSDIPVFLILGNTIISSTTVNDDLTFNFLVKKSVLDELKTTFGGYPSKIFAAVDKIERSYKHDSEKRPVVFSSNSEKLSLEQEVQHALECLMVFSDSEKFKTSNKIPVWIKNNAGWWANDDIDDHSFILGIQFLITEGIIQIHSVPQGTQTSNEIPSWIKNNAGWWADGTIDDSTFLSGVEFLVKEGMIPIGDEIC